MKRITVFLLITLLLCSLTVQGQDNYFDLDGHWAETVINKWSNLGIFKGHNGYFNPDDYITRGDFAVILNGILKYDTVGENYFYDLYDDYYTEDLLKLCNVKIIRGDNGYIRPKDFITREEAIVMLARGYNIGGKNDCKKTYIDIKDADDWALPYIYSFSDLDLIKGENNKINPKSYILRCEVIALIDRLETIPGNKNELPKKEEQALDSKDLSEEFEISYSKDLEIYISIEAFTVSAGYIIPPKKISVSEGVKLSDILVNLLEEAELGYISGGSIDKDFYLSRITNIKNFKPKIPEILKIKLEEDKYDYDDYMFNDGELGEFDFTCCSGWLYSVNGDFIEFGMSDCFPEDKDVIRIQFSCAYGSDIGGGFMTSDYFEKTKREELTKIVAEKGYENLEEYKDLITKVDLSEDELNLLIKELL